MRTKTRLFNGGLADIVRQAKERLPDSAFLNEAQPLVGPQAAGPETDSQVAEVEAPRPLPPRPAPFGRTTLMGHAFDLSGVRDGAAWAPGAELRSTRLVPIESLLAKPPEPAAPAPPPLPTADAPSEPEVRVATVPSGLRAPRFRPTSAQLRRGLMGLLALAALVLFALPKPRPLPALPAPATVATHAPSAPTPPLAKNVIAASTLPSGAVVTPRHAVDALVSGDYAAAQRIYTQLAREAPGEAVYAEAARILDERIRTRSY